MHTAPATPARYKARFSDGRTAATGEATVALSPAGLSITAPGHDAPVVWPYAGIRTAQPLTRRATDVLVVRDGQEGPTLFVSDAGFVAALSAQAPHLTAGAQRWTHARPWLLVTCAVAAVAGLFWLADFSPARTAARMLPDSARQTLGKQVVTQMLGSRKVCETADGKAALDKLATRLQAALPGSPRFKIVVADWGLVNAFAAPGGQIVLTRGLLSKAAGADEVAGVLAHEMGHALELHPETGIVRAIGLAAAADLMMGGSGGAMTNIGLMLAQLSYSRGAERDADTIALRTLKSAQVSAAGLKEFLERAQKTDGKSSNGTDILSTHPAMAQRIAQIAAQPPYAAEPALSPEEWWQLRGICGTSAAPRPDGAGPSREDRPGAKRRQPPRPPEPEIRL